MISSNKRTKNMKESIQKLFSSDVGMFVLKCLKEDYVDRSCLDRDPTIMAYNLGQKELIQGLIAELQREEELEKMNTETFDL